MLDPLSVLLFVWMVPAVSYWFLLALASIRAVRQPARSLAPQTRFVIAIPAHDEESVIAGTVTRLQALDYPSDLVQLQIVADHCSDGTVARARAAGAIVHERNSGPRTGKGAALAWLFDRVLAEQWCDAVVVFDADTQVDPSFLRLMDARLQTGELAIQGRHLIRNPDDGWFSALTWAMFMVDNRFQNQGRSNLGWSAKNMGDAICLRADVLRRVGWGEGLTEDYQLRQKLLLADIRITYEPAAIGAGEAVASWQQAQAQRARWLRGTHDAGKDFARLLLTSGLRRRNLPLLDGAAQAYLPAYSTLTIASVVLLAAQLVANWFWPGLFVGRTLAWWGGLTLLLFLYPLFGLALERAPLRAYVVMLAGPLFILWRTWLAAKSRFGRQQVSWIRTAHGEPR